MTIVRDAGDTICFNNGRGRIRLHTMAALFLAFASSIASHLVQAGELDKVVAFDIAPATLDKALLELGAQVHVQIMFAWDSSTKRHRTPGLKGRYTGKEALAEILRGTRLMYVERGHTLEILPQASAGSSSSAGDHKSPDAQPDGDPQTPNDPASKGLDPPAPNRRSQIGQPPQSLEEVTVTAQKYRQSALEVPISLIVIGSQQLQEDHIGNLNDLQYDVPGLRVEGGGAQQRIVIRGVGNDFGNAAYVSEYIDDADVTSAGYAGASGYGGADLQTYDLARVEVLRGPQGTLYGDSALGGTIRFITNEPVLDQFEMDSTVELPFTQYGAPSEHIEAMINAPLITSTLGLRISGQFNHDGGWIDEPAANLKNINGDNSTDLRIESLWEPISQFNARVMQIVQREAYGLSQGEDTTGNFTQLFNATTVPNAEKSFSLSNLRLSYDFAGMRLLSSSTYSSSAETLHDYSTISPGVADETISSAVVPQRKFTEEVRLAGAAAGSWRWMVGGFYDHDRSDLVVGPYYLGLDSLPITLSSLPSAIQGPGNTQLQGANSWAAFGDTNYKLANRLTVGAGVRYFKDRETESAPPSIPSAAATFASTDPRVYVEYQVASDVSTYVSASKGFRSGGFNPFTHPYSPESLWNYELGTKMELADNRLLANVDAFWSNYSNYLGEAISPGLSPFPEIYNIGNATIKGVEGSLQWRPSERWLLSMSGDLDDAKIASIASSAFDASYDVGDEVPLSSKYQLATSIERDFHWKNRPASVRLDYSQLGPQINYEPTAHSDRIRMLGLDARIQWSDDLSLGLFGQNLLNDRGLLDPFGQTDTSSRPRPRTFGFDFSVALR